ncbi:MAG: DUF3316 domain-containing protein [Paludibacteraceae bacterium]|nr:DUF3316 domain-containing protein [Paludibacteraceae bacterium]
MRINNKGVLLFTACLLLEVLFPCILTAENVEHENILKIQYGGAWRQDQYLSPTLYDGMMVGLGNEWWQPFSQDSRLGKAGKLDHWQHVGCMDLLFDWTYNPTRSNVLYAVGVNVGWGAHYTWQWQQQGVQVLLGPYLDWSNTVKYHVRNVNKPISLDASLQAMAMAGVSYAFHGKNTSYRLRYLVWANLIGVDFMPDYWQSYYELTEQVQGTVRCAGMWNHRTLRQELTLDMQFPHSTWRVGIAHEYDEYGEKNMMFSHEQVSAIVGTCFHYRLNPKHNFTIF